MALSPEVSVSNAKRLGLGQGLPPRPSCLLRRPPSSYCHLVQCPANRGWTQPGATSMAASNMLNCPFAVLNRWTSKESVGIVEEAVRSRWWGPRRQECGARGSEIPVLQERAQAMSASAGSSAMAGKSSSKSMSTTIVASSTAQKGQVPIGFDLFLHLAFELVDVFIQAPPWNRMPARI